MWAKILSKTDLRVPEDYNILVLHLQTARYVAEFIIQTRLLVRSNNSTYYDTAGARE